MIGAVLELIGLASVLAIALTLIKIAWDNYIKPLKCNHNYKIEGRLWALNGTILFLKCEKCGKEKNIEICEHIEITKKGE